MVGEGEGEPAVTDMQTLSQVRELNSRFPLSGPIERWKQRGGKAIGYMCTYVPEELICAAGALPVRVTGDSRELPLGDANAHLHPVSCSFTRQCLQLALEGQYSFLDGFIGGNNCDSIRRLVDNWLHYVPTPFTYILDVPHRLTPRAVEYYHGVLVDLKEKLEGFLGIDISDQALREAIDLCNTTRNLLRELYELRKQDAPPISGAETMEVLNAGFRMPKGEYNQLLVSLLKEARAGRRQVRGDIRVEGVVWYANVGCINSVAWAKLLRDALAEKGIPMLFLGCDYVDPTYVSEAELKDKTEAFFEMLEERKGK